MSTNTTPPPVRAARPLTRAETIAYNRKKIDDALADWHASQLEVETVEKAIADATAPFVEALAGAKGREAVARDRVKVATQAAGIS